MTNENFLDRNGIDGNYSSRLRQIDADKSRSEDATGRTHLKADLKAKFAQVQKGMTGDEVLVILGPPQRVLEKDDGEKVTWAYEPSDSQIGVFAINFRDGKVSLVASF